MKGDAFLTEEELQDLTKAKQPTKQGQVLDQNGIYYIRRADKTIITTWYHVNHPYESSAKPESNGIDLSKVA